MTGHPCGVRPSFCFRYSCPISVLGDRTRSHFFEFMVPSMRAVWCGNSTVSHGRHFFLRPDMFGAPPDGQREHMA